jgi:predicted aldo/keto reductase-like oxidoreductase
MVSDISFGCGPLSDANVCRYAYDHGVNYFDTAENYANGTAEKLIGEAIQFMDRDKIFITSKIHVDEKETEEDILKRFRKCLERLKTDRLDAFFMHNVTDPSGLDHEGFHAAVKRLKTEGRLKHIGISCHGSRGQQGGSMERAVCAAAEDGRFDVVLFVYNFMNKEEGEKILAACKKNNVGATAMKTAPGVLKIESIDPENLTAEQEEMVKRMQDYGMSRVRALERLKQRSERQKETVEKTRPFAEKHRIKTKAQLQNASIQWVLQNQDVHTVCVSFASFDQIDRILPASGKKLSQADARFLRDFKTAYDSHYCRHACSLCCGTCPREMPVSTIMRLAYYYEMQGREKYAMREYARIGVRNASQCIACDAPCLGSCPHGLDVQAHLLQAHSLLRFA